MSPEQARGAEPRRTQRPLLARLRPLRDGGGPQGVPRRVDHGPALQDHHRGAAAAPRARSHASPTRIVRIIAKAIAKAPENRYQTGRELADDLLTLTRPGVDADAARDRHADAAARRGRRAHDRERADPATAPTAVSPRDAAAGHRADAPGARRRRCAHDPHTRPRRPPARRPPCRRDARASPPPSAGRARRKAGGGSGPRSWASASRPSSSLAGLGFGAWAFLARRGPSPVRRAARTGRRRHDRADARATTAERRGRRPRPPAATRDSGPPRPRPTASVDTAPRRRRARRAPAEHAATAGLRRRRPARRAPATGGDSSLPGRDSGRGPGRPRRRRGPRAEVPLRGLGRLSRAPASRAGSRFPRDVAPAGARPPSPRSLHLLSAEEAYQQANGALRHPAGPAAAPACSHLDVPFADGAFQRARYRFQVTGDGREFRATATPLTVGPRPFVVDDSGFVRVDE